MYNMSPIPIIGLGAVCSAGYGVKTGYNAISEGEDGLSPLSLFETGLKKTPPCGEVKEDLFTFMSMKSITLLPYPL